jgi:hypothetical protein
MNPESRIQSAEDRDPITGTYTILLAESRGFEYFDSSFVVRSCSQLFEDDKKNSIQDQKMTPAIIVGFIDHQRNR